MQGLQKRVGTELEVGEHSQLFQSLHGEVLRFVHHQQAAPPRTCLFMKETFNRTQCGGLVVPLNIKAEALRDDMHDLFAAQLAGNDLTDSELCRIDRGDHVRDQRGLARANLAGDHNKAFTLGQPVA